MWTVPEAMASLPVLLFTDGWKATASHNADIAGDGLTLAAWTSGVPQQAGMWFQVELPKAETVAELHFQSPPAGERGAAVSLGGAPVATPAGPGYPRQFKVEVSLNGTSWTNAAAGAATGVNTIVPFEPAPARFVRITLTANADSGPPWSVQSLRLYGIPARR
jgi:hypothetical protein